MLTVILTLEYQDTGMDPEERIEIVTLKDVRTFSMDPRTGFLVIETDQGAYNYDPAIWRQINVARTKD